MKNDSIVRPSVCDCCYDVWYTDDLTKIDFGQNLFVDLCPKCYEAFKQTWVKKENMRND